jgi:dephospho-CoA kinase
VAVPTDVRQRRAELRGWPPGELERREAAQIPLEEKQRLSDYLVDNSQTIEQTFKQVQRIWNQLFKRSHGGEL